MLEAVESERGKDGVKALVQFLSACDVELGETIRIDVKRWLGYVARKDGIARKAAENAAFLEMQSTVRALDYEPWCINMRTLTDERSRTWDILTAYRGRWWVKARLHANGRKHDEGSI